ncbi:histidinol-phosphatase [Defluviicoccus vanus]|uniref:Histidinol-phosphatase n=1 Tax=Defluviicoccus vanus TaxID=111831 RepID=A0A7H1MYI7_9PROT|nr:histidinol-phosphatase [Defluviicoccus vanus]QNT68523.1 histidinol-phosphatase [Defluviicoccus vanus]
MTDLSVFVQRAEAMADAVRPVVLKYFADPVAFQRKSDSSPVTAADREAEAVMRRLIEQTWPDHGILGEEYGADRTDTSFVWVLDPIDGTKSFVTGKPLFGTLIALTRDGVPIVGIIDMPALGQRWVGAEGRVTTFNGEPVSVRSCPNLADAWLYATSPQMFEGDDVAAFERLRQRCYAAVYGADLYAYGLVARGRVDLVCEASLQPYDYCAVVPVLQGAGGTITDWEGRALGLTSGGRVLAAGDRKAHAAGLAALTA